MTFEMHTMQIHNHFKYSMTTIYNGNIWLYRKIQTKISKTKNSVFAFTSLLYTDGWMDGWMDGYENYL